MLVAEGLFALVATFAAACGPAPVCAPAATQTCACPGGAMGVQTCSASGTGFSACACPGADGGTDPCVNYVTCAACTAVNGCGFCDGRCQAGTASGPAAGRCSGAWTTTATSCAPPTTGGTYTFVVSAMSIDSSDTDTVPHTGFNLDGLCSDGSHPADCGHTDYVSALDPDQNSPASCSSPGPSCHGCVDNQLPTLASSLQGTGVNLATSLSGEISSSRRVYIVYLSGVDSLTSDDSVTVSVFDGLPTFSTDCQRVLPDREYQVARSSVRTGGTNLDDARLRLTGRIVAGRLSVEGAASDVLALPLGGSGSPAPPLELHGPRMRVDLTAASGARGNLGGQMPGVDLAARICAASPSYCSLASTVVAGLVDIQTGGVCADTASSPPRYGSVGLGVGFELVRARIRADAPIADARPAGACGG